MATLLIECPPSTSQEQFARLNESLTKALSSKHDHLLYVGTSGDYGLKISVILGNGETLASIYDNCKDALTVLNEHQASLEPKPAANVRLEQFKNPRIKAKTLEGSIFKWPFKRKGVE